MHFARLLVHRQTGFVLFSIRGSSHRLRIQWTLVDNVRGHFLYKRRFHLPFSFVFTENIFIIFFAQPDHRIPIVTRD